MGEENQQMDTGGVRLTNVSAVAGFGFDNQRNLGQLLLVGFWSRTGRVGETQEEEEEEGDGKVGKYNAEGKFYMIWYKHK